MGVLGARLRRQMTAVERASMRTRAPYDFTRRALAATSEHDMALAIVNHVSTTMNAETALLARLPDGEFEIAAASPAIGELDATSLAAAEWSWANRRRAGWRTDTLPEAQ